MTRCCSLVRSTRPSGLGSPRPPAGPCTTYVSSTRGCRAASRSSSPVLAPRMTGGGWGTGPLLASTWATTWLQSRHTSRSAARPALWSASPWPGPSWVHAAAGTAGPPRGTSGHDGRARIAGHTTCTATTLDIEPGQGRVRTPRRRGHRTIPWARADSCRRCCSCSSDGSFASIASSRSKTWSSRPARSCLGGRLRWRRRGRRRLRTAVNCETEFEDRGRHWELK